MTREKITGSAPWIDWRDEVEDGGLVMMAERSGGAFDPLGGRAFDRDRSDDFVALVDALQGRWVMVALTIDRSMWTCPEAAHQRCTERVRKVGQVLSGEHGIWFRALELQTKTGEGWPHWHVIARLQPSDTRSAEELKAAVSRAWRVRTSEVDHESGEVLSSSIESVGFVDVQIARDRRGAARYMAKYLSKQWPAVPSWMGESVRRFRKWALSPASYEVLERLHRHTVKRGGRRPSGRGRRLRARRVMFERMASSGSRSVIFRKDRCGRLKLAAVVPLAVCSWRDVLDLQGVRVLRAGKWASMRVEISDDVLSELVEPSSAEAERPGQRVLRERRDRWARERREYLERGRLELEVSWEFMQERRGEVERGDVH